MSLRFIVRFDRYTRNNADDRIAMQNFRVADLRTRLTFQLKAELAANPAMRDCCCDLFSAAVVHDNLFVAWAAFTWPGSGVDFCRALQATYDEYEMTGFYEIVDAVDLAGGNLYYPAWRNTRDEIRDWVWEAEYGPRPPPPVGVDSEGRNLRPINLDASR